MFHLRCSNDHLCVYEVFVEGRVLAFLVGSGDELMALILDPLPDSKLILGAAKQLWLVLGMLASL